MKYTVWVAGAVLCSSAFAQAQKPMKRTADGKPDLSGVWQAGGVSLYGEPGSGKAAPPTSGDCSAQARAGSL